jgi:hypothetical protein
MVNRHQHLIISSVLSLIFSTILLVFVVNRQQHIAFRPWMLYCLVLNGLVNYCYSNPLQGNSPKHLRKMNLKMMNDKESVKLILFCYFFKQTIIFYFNFVYLGYPNFECYRKIQMREKRMQIYVTRKT